MNKTLHVRILFDEAAVDNLITKRAMQRSKFTTHEDPVLTITGVDGKEQSSQYVVVPVTDHNGHTRSYVCHVIENEALDGGFGTPPENVTSLLPETFEPYIDDGSLSVDILLGLFDAQESLWPLVPRLGLLLCLSRRLRRLFCSCSLGCIVNEIINFNSNKNIILTEINLVSEYVPVVQNRIMRLMILGCKAVIFLMKKL